MNSSGEKALFALALEKPADKRAVFLDAKREDGHALRQRLEARLAAHEAADPFLASATADANPEDRAQQRRDQNHPRSEPIAIIFLP